MAYHVLLAEDDEISQDIVRAFLKDESDIQLTVVGDGKAALEAALTKRFDLLILDQNLPSITGDRIVRHLRAGNAKNSATPILRFSANYREAATDSSDAAILKHLPKPVSGELLVNTIRSILPRG